MDDVASDNGTSQPSSTSPDSDSSTPPEWAAQFVDLARTASLDVEKDMFPIVRALLYAPDRDTDAPRRAVQQVQEYYRAKFLPPDEEWWIEKSERGAWYVAGSLTDYVFQVVDHVPFEDLRQARLADFLVALRDLSAKAFDIKDPWLVISNKSISGQAAEHWRDFEVNAGDNFENCNLSLNMYAFLALLIRREMVDEWEWYASRSLAEGLEGAEDPAKASEIVSRCRTSITAQFILRAGEVLVETARDDSKLSQGSYPLNQEKWKAWAAKFRDIAESTPERAEWDLKIYAGRAHEKMVELWPELFVEGN